jgi:hypothetical protein
MTQILTSLLKAEESLSATSLFLHIILLLLSAASRIFKILRVDSGPEIPESPWLSGPGLSLCVSLWVSLWVSSLLLSLSALARDAYIISKSMRCDERKRVGKRGKEEE